MSIDNKSMCVMYSQVSAYAVLEGSFQQTSQLNPRIYDTFRIGTGVMGGEAGRGKHRDHQYICVACHSPQNNPPLSWRTDGPPPSDTSRQPSCRTETRSNNVPIVFIVSSNSGNGSQFETKSANITLNVLLTSFVSRDPVSLSLCS